MAHDAIGTQAPQDGPAGPLEAAGLDDMADLDLGYEAADPTLLARLWGEPPVAWPVETRP